MEKCWSLGTVTDQSQRNTTCIIALHLRYAETISFKLSVTGLTFVQATITRRRIIRDAIFDRQGEGVFPGSEYEMGHEAQEV